MEIIVNGGRVSCHVAKSDSDEKFTANFIPHDAGRHRLDVKFNGDKVPGSPWFCEVGSLLNLLFWNFYATFTEQVLREVTVPAKKKV